MTNPDKQNPVEASDVEAAAKTETTQGSGMSSFSAITQRWKREDLVKKASPITRGLCLLFSLLAFIIMVSNKHGYGRNFDDYEEYKWDSIDSKIHLDYEYETVFLKVSCFLQIRFGDCDHLNGVHCVANVCISLEKRVLRSPDFNVGRFLRRSGNRERLFVKLWILTKPW